MVNVRLKFRIVYYILYLCRLFLIMQSTGFKMRPRGRPKMPCRKLPPKLNSDTTDTKMNKDKWQEETTRFGNILRRQEEVILPPNMFREMKQHINRLVESKLNWNKTHMQCFPGT